MTILVAGQQNELGDVLLPFLASRGYTLLFVQTADEFIEHVQTQPLDLIIMDLDLEAKDRFLIAEELKGDPKAISIPMIAVADSARLVPSLRELGTLLKQNAAAIL